jgi:RNA polymerase sigma-70 factor (ECF subfamily)
MMGYEAVMLGFLLAVAGTKLAREDDAQLIARVADRDSAALRKLYDRFSGRALAVAMRILGAPAEAEEVVQDAFVEVWRRAAQYDASRGGAATWITAIARNRAIDRLRTRGAQARAAEGAEKEAQAVGTVASSTPLEDVEQVQARTRIQDALKTLPPEQRLVIELAYFEGLSQSEIAAKTGDPLGTVKGRVRSAMEKLAALLHGREPRGGL